MGLSGDAKKEFLDNKLFTCEACLPQHEITFKAKSALNRHTKRFHTKEALKRRAMSASPSCKATNGKVSRLTKSTDVKKSKRRSPATAPVTPATPVTTLAAPKTSPKSEPVSKASADSGNKNPLLKSAPEESPTKGSANRNPLLTNGVSKSSPLKTPLPSGGIFKQPLSTPRPTKNLVMKKPANETRSSLPMAFRMNKCNFCQKSFSRESILNVHLEMIHKKEKMELEMKTKEEGEEVRDSSAPLVDAKEKDEKVEKSSAPPVVVEAKKEAEEECDDSSATSINASKDEPPVKEEAASKMTSDADAATANTPTAPAAPPAPPLTNGCEGTESEESGMESEEEVFMEVEEEDIDLTNHPNLVEKKTSGVVVDKEWKGTYLSRKKADADAPSEENKRISARLRDKVNSNSVGKRKEISRETPPPVSKKRRKKEVTAEVVKKVPQELTEDCIYSEEQWGGCKRKFYSYFSMMRHVAFVHRPERTVEMMRIKSTAQPIKNPAMPILMGLEAKRSEGEETAKAPEGAPESVSSTSASASATETQESSLNNEDESPDNVEQEGSSTNSNEKTDKEGSESREDVKAVIEGVVEEVVRREAPSSSSSSSSKEHSQPKREIQVGEEVSSISSRGAETPQNDEVAVATVVDDVPPKAEDEPSSGGSDSSEDKDNGVPDAIKDSEAIKDAPTTKDLLDDTVEMEIAAAASSEVVAAAN